MTLRVALQGAFNFRDLGGYRTSTGAVVARGRVYRADGLHRLTGADVAVLEGLGIGRIFDLRSDAELARDGLGPFASEPGRHVHVPLMAVSLSPLDPEIDWSNIDLQDRYVEMLREGGRTIRRILLALASPSAPASVFHCTGGKDRTGVVAAVLLRALGVPDDDVVEDYARSQRNLSELMAIYREELLARGLGPGAIAYLTSSPPARMRRTLAELDRLWGSTEDYLAAIGVGAAELEELRGSLLS